MHNVGFVHANGHQALRGVSLEAKSGERIAIIGPSGAGKTTLLRVFATALRPSAGGISVLGSNPWRLQEARFQTGPDTKLLLLKIVRQPAAPLIRGKFWIDDLRLVEK